MTDKPAVFIGSSSEGLNVAETLQVALERAVPLPRDPFNFGRCIFLRQNADNGAYNKTAALPETSGSSEQFGVDHVVLIKFSGRGIVSITSDEA